MTITRFKTIIAAALITGSGVFLGTAQTASAVTCPDPAPSITTDPYRYMSFDGGTSCLDYGIGATADALFQAGNPDYVFIAKVEMDTAENAGNPDEGEEALDGIFVATNGSGGSLWSGLLGTIDWTPPDSFEFFAVLFKFGNPSTNESWFVFTLPSTGFTESAWAALNAAGGAWISPGELSHTSLYGISPIPVPAAGFLLIGALGGLVALRRRRKTV